MTGPTIPTPPGASDYGGPERRKWARYSLRYPVLLVAERPGQRVEASGTTVNVSKGGVLVHVEPRIEPHAHVTIRFRREARGRLKPEETAGVVRHVRPQEDGTYHVAIEFYVPLEGLKRPGEF